MSPSISKTVPGPVSDLPAPLTDSMQLMELISYALKFAPSHSMKSP